MPNDHADALRMMQYADQVIRTSVAQPLIPPGLDPQDVSAARRAVEDALSEMQYKDPHIHIWVKPVVRPDETWVVTVALTGQGEEAPQSVLVGSIDPQERMTVRIFEPGPWCDHLTTLAGRGV